MTMQQHLPAPPTAGPFPGASAWITVDGSAVRDNVAALRRRAGSAQVMGIVKADAYGHGLLPVARAALAGGAHWLGVAQLAEALLLRDALTDAGLLDTPLFTWLYPPGADLAPALVRGIDLSVAALWALEAVLDAARRTGRTARVHLKVDTGLGRGGALGAGWDDLVAAAAAAAAAGAVEIVGLWSHFASADLPGDPSVRAQLDRFVAADADLARHGIRPALRHIANSAALLTEPASHFDLVRPGLACYGLSPVPQLGGPARFGLREAMRVTARLALVKDVEAGQGVSYGHHYTTDRRTRLGLVPMGYADGIPRAASGCGPVSVGGRRHTVAGRVCMDQFVLDLGPDFDGAAGDEVVVFGRSADGEPTAEDWARATGTISYEIVTRMSSRLPRLQLPVEATP